MNTIWKPDPRKCIETEDVARIITDLKRRAKRSASTKMSLTIFRLAVGCGLRVSEICGLKMCDVQLDQREPRILIPTEITKGGKGANKKRSVPLTWSKDTRGDLAEWKAARKKMGAKPQSYFVCVLTRKNTDKVTRHLVKWVQPRADLPSKDRPAKEKHWEDRTMAYCRGPGARLTRSNVAARFKRACKILGPERGGELSIHDGRHTFISHALAKGASIAEVRDAAGHSNFSTTNLYAHPCVNGKDKKRDFMEFDRP